MKKINKILIANRGEIAVRIMRTAHEMGIKTVAIYSDVDKYAVHTRYADEAYYVGGSKATESYLNMNTLIKIAKTHKVDAIHPGYGFLSENAEFAQKVAEEGILFIGPSPHAIQIMGDKISSKKTVKNGNVPLVPGMDEPISNTLEAKKIAEKIGYPIMIKASAGGGGKGMRIIENAEAFDTQMERAQSEARHSFGNDAVFLEKFIQNPKHIEVQILADSHGNYVYLFERDCSIQRRHQKIIEEAPAPLMTPEKRKALGTAAVNVAKSCQYVGAGTVEFVADLDLNFYFLEMNTRLQVEHPITEEITGIDIVKEQIRIAEGHPLSFCQKDLQIKGHSIEVRVYAEDCEKGFLPDTGVITQYDVPKGPGIRVDDGMEKNSEISIYYDSMIAKLVATGSTREMAIARMKRAIKEYQIEGIKTTLPFCEFVLNHKNFLSKKFTTHFVDSYYKPEYLHPKLENETKEIASILATQSLQYNWDNKKGVKTKANTSNWRNRLK